MQNPRISVIEAAQIMNVNPQYIRVGLQQKIFQWGYAVKTSKNRYTYYIDRGKFMESVNNKYNLDKSNEEIINLVLNSSNPLRILLEVMRRLEYNL